MSTGSILSILAYPQYGYHMVYHTGLSLVHCRYLSVGSLHALIKPDNSPPFAKLLASALIAPVLSSNSLKLIKKGLFARNLQLKS